MKAYLILENGMTFEGRAFGYIKEAIGEVVFNTGMTGYQEVLTDPSYYGQIVTMTYPLIGNYGINLDDMESKGVKVKGFVVRELCKNPSNWRNELELSSYLKQNRVIGIEGIDTRALTKVLRTNGTMKGIITVRELEKPQIKQNIKSYNNINAVKSVTTSEIIDIEGSGKHIALIDFGIKNNIIEGFKKRNCKLTIFPATTDADTIMSYHPDMVFLSNGPGDPKDVSYAIPEINKLVGKVPMCGICLGHQLIALALGYDTEKLKFGHRGCNHPVKDIINNKVMITSQNHGYVVKENGLDKEFIITHINVNDKTIEGMRHKNHPIFSVQFHPEACPGPHDTDGIFDEFLELTKGGNIYA